MYNNRNLPQISIAGAVLFCPHCGQKIYDATDVLWVEKCPHLVYAVGSNETNTFWAVRYEFARAFIDKLLVSEFYLEATETSEDDPLSKEIQAAFIEASFDPYVDSVALEIGKFCWDLPHTMFPELLSNEACVFVDEHYHSVLYIAVDHGVK